MVASSSIKQNKIALFLIFLIFVFLILIIIWNSHNSSTNKSISSNQPNLVNSWTTQTEPVRESRNIVKLLDFWWIKVPNLFVYNLSPIWEKRYNMVDNKYYELAPQNLQFRLKWEIKQLSLSYKQLLQKQGWQVKLGNIANNFSVTKNGEKINIEFRQDTEKKEYTIMTFNYNIDEVGVLYKNPQKFSYIELPILPTTDVELVDNKTYNITWDSYNNVIKTIKLVWAWDITSNYNTLKSDLEKNGWKIEESLFNKKDKNIQSFKALNWDSLIAINISIFENQKDKVLISMDYNNQIYSTIDFSLNKNLFKEFDYVAKQPRRLSYYIYPTSLVFSVWDSFETVKKELEKEMKQKWYKLNYINEDTWTITIVWEKNKEHMTTRIISPIPLEYSKFFEWSTFIEMTK